MAGDWEESRIPVTTIVGLALAMATLWLVQEPLKSSRPEIEQYKPLEDKLVQARLWEDPFEAIENHRRDNERGGAPAVAEINFSYC